MTKAYQYSRFSSAKQAKGDSQRRQDDSANEMARENGWTIDTSLTFRDCGVSGFHGKNAESGALSVFLEAVTKGIVKPGDILIIENLDRLSRQVPRISIRLFTEIIEKGVTIATTMGRKIYTPKS